MQTNTEVVVNNDGRGGKAGKAQGDARWWQAEPSGKPDAPIAVHDGVVGRARTLKSAWRKMEIQDRIHDRIYENRALRAGGTYRAAVDALERAGFQTARLFVTTSIVDTFTSRISKKRPMPMFVVDDAEWSLKRKAQRFRRFLHSKLRETEFDRLCSEIVNDACVRGTGVAYIDEHDHDVLVERVHRHEILLEPREARMGAKGIRQLHWIRQVSREVLKAKFPEFADAIDKAPASASQRHDAAAGDDWLLAGETVEHEDVIDVTFSWHLKSGPNCEDGRRAVCIENATLCYDHYDGDRFPFAFLHRYKPKRGFWGRGDVELLRDLQARVNAIVRDVQQNLDVHGKIMVSVNEQYDIPTDQLTGRYPFKLKWRGPQGSQPQWIIPQPVSPGQIQALELVIQKMHDLIGVSQWATSSKNPVGAGASGIALDTFYDIESERHAVFEDDYANFRLDAARLFLDCGYRVVDREHDEADEEAERKKKAKARGKKYEAPERRRSWMDVGGLASRDWSEFALEQGQYRMELEPVSFIPSTRAGKLAAVKELTTSGVLPTWMAASLFDEPDIAHANRVFLAAYHNLERIMEDLGDEDIEATMPEPEHDLELGLMMAKAYYNRAQSEKAPESIQRRYRAWMQAALREQKKGKSAAAQDPAAAMGAPMPGAPGAPPMDPAMAAAAGGMPPMPIAA